MATQNQNKTRVIIIVAVLGLIAAGGLYLALKPEKPRDSIKQTRGRVTAIDAANRTASLELVNSKTGELVPVNDVELPADDKIRIDGKPASVRDVQVGDKVFIERKGMTILSVNIQRETPGSETRPTTTAPGS